MGLGMQRYICEIREYMTALGRPLDGSTDEAITEGIESAVESMRRPGVTMDEAAIFWERVQQLTARDRRGAGEGVDRCRGADGCDSCGCGG
jgi:hypothetical protein